MAAIAIELVEMNFWVFLLFIAVGLLFTALTLLRPPRWKYATIIKMGLFLALFDLVFQTLGLYAGYWRSANSVLLLGPAVPLEVLLIAFCTGAMLNLVFNHYTLHRAAAFALLIAGVGTFFEAILVNAGNLVYAGGWTSYHAFAAYFAVFLFFQWVNNIWLVQPHFHGIHPAHHAGKTH